MIYTVTLNPAIDYYIKITNLLWGEVNRTNSETVAIGGKGINVSRALTELGMENIALGFTAGLTGELVRKEFPEFIEIEGGNTRINVKILEGEYETEVNGQGPFVSINDAKKLFRKIEDSLVKDDVIVLSGSVPKSLPSAVYANIIRYANQIGVYTFVDTSGSALVESMKAKPFLISPNLSELETAIGYERGNVPKLKKNDEKDKDDDEQYDVLDEALLMGYNAQHFGSRHIIVTCGSDGAVLLQEDSTCFKKRPKDIFVGSTVGLGDKLLARFIYNWVNTKNFKESFDFCMDL
ncbi:MAG: 1-phosphofructokinase family hexose kinase [Ruminococcus sp.]|jgi:1-phosphofructokinase|nr:1-phosphofructokinase family hexose kinase [Ruminococcus sp.]